MSETNKQWAARRLAPVKGQQSAFSFMEQLGAGSGRFPLEELSADNMKDAIVSWLAQGYAITFSVSADGGAFGVILLARGEPRKRFFGSVAEAEDFLTHVRDSGGPPMAR